MPAKRTPKAKSSPITRGEAARPAAPRRTLAAGAGQPLSLAQKAALNTLASQAFAVQEKMGNIEFEPGQSRSAALTAWRRKEQQKAVGLDSLTECGNNHYRTLKGHFLAAAGRDPEAFGIFMRTGRVKDRGPLDDTHENRETQRRLIMDALLEHGRRCDPQAREHDPVTARLVEEAGGIITAAYVVKVAKAKFKGRDLGSLIAQELREIFWTIRNRINAKEGKGSKGTRNKRQAKKGGKGV